MLYAVHEFSSMCFIMLTSNFVKNFPCKSCPDKSFLEGRNRNDGLPDAIGVRQGRHQNFEHRCL